LPTGDRKKVVFVTIIQLLLGLLDLLGVMAIGLLGALSVTGLKSQEPGNRVSSVLDFLKLSDFSFQSQAAFIGSMAVFLLIGRTILSIIFTRRILFFMSRRGASLSADLIARLLSQSLLKIQSRSTQEIIYAISAGVEMLVMQILATTVVMIADLSLLIIMAVGLLLVDPITAIGTLLIFSVIGFFLYKFMHVRAKDLGRMSSVYAIESSEKIMEVLSSYRETVVRNRRDFYAREIGSLRLRSANVTAETNFLPFVSKYVIESAVILGALVIGMVQLILQDSAHAIATLGIFLAAGTRIAPAVLRVQQGLTIIRTGFGQAEPTLQLISSMQETVVQTSSSAVFDSNHVGFTSNVSLSNVSLTYPNKKIKAVEKLSIKISEGSLTAFVGPSGAGKTTVIDILLGILKPDEGRVLISGMDPLEAFAKWPGAVSYVPQDVAITSGTIRQNVSLGFPISEASDELVYEALAVANLDNFVQGLPDKLETHVGERGSKLSGGQRQRLGIARAMFTKPKLLVLDEATSSLDVDTEENISKSINALKGRTTVVLIAHRLSTVRKADLVVYLESGKIISTGNFDEVRKSISNFDNQAKLFGL
jgi:ABC-type multidrug transport system fused ATPase/permease subunit